MPQPWSAWAVHAYTASGAVMAFAATRAAIDRDFTGACLWLVAAVVVDATDGWLARRAQVHRRLPLFSGRTLDDIVDYLTYVFVPAVIIDRAQLLPDGLTLPIVAGVLLSSGYGFANADAKTDDHFFTGFPSYWNIVALYLLASHLPRTANAVILMACTAMVFVRTRWIYPTRTERYQALTLVGAAVWTVQVIALVLTLPSPPQWLLLSSLAYPLYYVALSLRLDQQARQSQVLREGARG